MPNLFIITILSYFLLQVLPLSLFFLLLLLTLPLYPCCLLRLQVLMVLGMAGVVMVQVEDRSVTLFLLAIFLFQLKIKVKLLQPLFQPLLFQQLPSLPWRLSLKVPLASQVATEEFRLNMVLLAVVLSSSSVQKPSPSPSMPLSSPSTKAK